MRTTLDIDADVLAAAKEISQRSKRTTGSVVSELARVALTSCRPVTEPSLQNGFEVIPAEARVVSIELVRQIMEESETP